MEGVEHRQTSLTSQVPYKVVDPIMGGEKALGRAGRLEPLHLPLASPRRLVRILRPVVQMLWGGGDGMARSPPEVTDGAPHATAERLEPVTCCSEPGRHLDRSHRDEPIELARRRHCPRDRAPPAEEARARRGGAAGLARALAGRGDPGWAPDHAHRRRL